MFDKFSADRYVVELTEKIKIGDEKWIRNHAWMLKSALYVHFRAYTGLALNFCIISILGVWYLDMQKHHLLHLFPLFISACDTERQLHVVRMMTEHETDYYRLPKVRK